MAKSKDITPLVLTFVNHRTPELRRAPEHRDPDGATLELWLKYEGAKKYRWQGRASMDAGKLAEALAVIKDDSQVILRLPSGTIPRVNDPVLAVEAVREGYFNEMLTAAHELVQLLKNKDLEGATGVAARLVLQANRAHTFVLCKSQTEWNEVATRTAAAVEEAGLASNGAEIARNEKEEETRETKTASALASAEKTEKATQKALEEAKKAMRTENLDRDTTSPRPANADLLLQVSNQRWTLPGVLWYEGDDA